MAETRIDTPRSAESRVAKTTAQAMTSVKSTLAAGDEAPAFSSLLAALDSFAATGLPQVALPPGDAQEEKTTLPGLAEQDTLLVAQGHAPWMSLVGQTARLDTQGDDDMRQGAATDFLSGRSNVTQLAHRQALQTGDVGAGGAHAAFMGKDLQSNQPQAQSIQAQVATNFDDAALPVKADHSEQSQSALLAAADEPVAARAEQAAQKLQAAGHQGVSLQGMTAVQPQTLEGLKDLLRAARPASLDEGGVAGKPGSSSGSHDLTGAAVAIGAAMGAAGAGMQGGGQNASDLGQSLSGQESAPAEREQEVSEQVAFWVHQKVQNASLSIQHEGKPIQVQVQLNGQEAHVRFAADDEQARQLLADGQSQLRELLEAQGLNLSGVSVDAGGAHQQGAGGQSDDGQRAQARSARVAVNAADLPVDALNTRQVSRAAQTGVDLFV
ncbi:flagellar hook-length control protein FliK [Comamonas suwonensis]|uniref:flagellar hook-length control protein FliK n=1 Tax=Comamonas suwonensis TaxID=2606214 RepID=UPI00145C857B|nr:flagellar hook-length control protein FliK [Comamonas suwonensis]MBI1624496.1 flagellar hook-length control protein FliK [Comamonas suwonensis]